MTAVIKLIWPYALAFLIGALLAFWLTSNRYKVTVATLQEAQEAQMKKISDDAAEQAKANAEKLTAAQNSLAELDKKSTEDLTNAQTENENLRRDVANGSRRVRIQASAIATCQGAVSDISSASGLGNAPSVELSGDFGQRVLDIRAGIINDRAKILYLQGFVKNLQQSGVVAK